MKKISILIITALLTLISCSKETATSQEKVDGTFILHSFGKEVIVAPADKRFPTLKFDNNTQKISGFAGCNTISGSYEASLGKITFSPIVATRKACFNDSYEPQILKALNDANSYTIEGDLLSLKKDKQTLLVLRKLKLN